MLPAVAAPLRVEFVSFDADRDGEHSLHDFIGMLQKLNIEYEFMAPDGPLMGAYAMKQWETTDERRGGHQHGEDDEGVHDDQPAVKVRVDGFCARGAWYPGPASRSARRRNATSTARLRSYPVRGFAAPTCGGANGNARGRDDRRYRELAVPAPYAHRRGRAGPRPVRACRPAPARVLAACESLYVANRIS